MILSIEGFNPCIDLLKEGQLVYYLSGHSPKLKIRMGRYVPASETDKWHVVDIETGKKKYPYTSEICTLDDFNASYVKVELTKCDRFGNYVNLDS